MEAMAQMSRASGSQEMPQVGHSSNVNVAQTPGSRQDTAPSELLVRCPERPSVQPATPIVHPGGAEEKDQDAKSDKTSATEDLEPDRSFETPSFELFPQSFESMSEDLKHISQTRQRRIQSRTRQRRIQSRTRQRKIREG